jgi:hypothetical protein
MYVSEECKLTNSTYEEQHVCSCSMSMTFFYCEPENQQYYFVQRTIVTSNRVYRLSEQ